MVTGSGSGSQRINLVLVGDMKNYTAFVYGLVDPRDGKVFYVGRTTAKAQQRLINHLRDGRKKRTLN